jgi:hypothetical protein
MPMDAHQLDVIRKLVWPWAFFPADVYAYCRSDYMVEYEGWQRKLGHFIIDGFYAPTIQPTHSFASVFGSAAVHSFTVQASERE